MNNKYLKLFYLLLFFLFVGGGNANAQLTQVDGYYQIGTAQDLKDFRDLVNNGTANGSNAVLTADITLSTSEYWSPIGTDNNKYHGTFDGQGHSIKNMKLDGTVKEQGLFGVCSGGVVIQNLIIDASCSVVGTGGKCIGAIIGCVNYSGTGLKITIQNCGNEMSFAVSEENNAGLVARDYSDDLQVEIINCYNKGNISGGWDNGAFTGWTPRVTVTNSYNMGRIYNENNYDGSNGLARGNHPSFSNSYDLNTENQYNQGQPSGYETTWLTSGKFAYTLNNSQDAGVFHQNLGSNSDPYPVPIALGHGAVYANGELDCDGITPIEGGVITYSNTEGGSRRSHTWGEEWGFCTVCDEINPNFLTPNNGYYELSTKQQLNWFSEYVNRVNNTVNGKLTADIDFSEQQTMIGNAEDSGHGYKGTFDGQGHKVTVGYTTTTNHASLFKFLYGGAVVRNLITNGTITKNGGQFGSGIFGGSHGDVLVENCVSYVTISSTVNGDATIGGIGAFMHDNGAIRNCAFLGTINAANADGSGGILGYANGGSRNIIENCYVNASITLKNTEENTDNSNKVISRNDPQIINCYYVGSTGNMQNFMADDRFTPQATEATAEQMQSGELAFLLNGSVDGGAPWCQTIRTDPQPLPMGTSKVYASGELRCDGTIVAGVSFSNDNSSSHTQASHNYVDGVCSVCGDCISDYMADTGGYYEISTGEQLCWLARYATSHPSVKVKLMSDIDMTGLDYVGIGTNSKANRFSGEIDGQGYMIKNLNMGVSGQGQGVGLVNAAADGATIKNLTIGKNCEINGESAVAAFIGAIRGSGDIYIENCGNEGTVTASGANAGGIVGCRFDNSTVHLTNVYNIGVITGGRESGSISGWLSDAVLNNCYSFVDYVTSANTHGFEEGKQFSRGNDMKLTNCYDYGTGDWGTNNSDWRGVFDPNSNWKIQSKADVENGSLFETNMVKTYTNPVLSSDAPDPSVIRADDGYYYLYSTAEHVYRSPDMVNWSYKGQVFGDNPKGTIGTDGEGGVFWAPCITKQNGQYVLYFAVSKVGGENDAWIGAATADSPAGPFRLVGTDGKLFTSSEIGVTNSIDPYFIEDGGKKYLVWGSFHGIYITELNADGLSVKDKSSKTPLLGDGFEAAYIYKRGDYYYLFASIGSTFNGSSSTYKTVVGRSTSLLGTYYKDKEGDNMAKTDGFLGIGAKDDYVVLLQNTSGFYGPGHNSRIIEDADGKTWMYFHAYDSNNLNERRVCLDEVKWDATDWPYFEGTGPTKTEQTGPKVGISGLNVDNVWHQSLGSFRHPVLYNGTEFDENYDGNQTPAADESNAIARLYRGLVAGNWNTICVPFSMTRAQINEAFGDGTELATLKDAKGETLHFQKLAATDGITAGTPYLIYPGHATTAATDVSDALFIKGVGIASGEPQQIEETSEHNYTFIGTYAKGVDPENGDLFVGAGNKLVKQNAHGTDNGKMKGFRAYLKKAAGAQAAKFFTVDDEPTGIMLPEGTVEMIDKVYNLNGQRVNPNSMRRGIYIVNGKKVLVK